MSADSGSPSRALPVNRSRTNARPVGARTRAETLGAGARAGLRLCEKPERLEKVHPRLDSMKSCAAGQALGRGSRKSNSHWNGVHKSTKDLELLKKHIFQKAKHKQIWGQDARSTERRGGAGCPGLREKPTARGEHGRSVITGPAGNHSAAYRGPVTGQIPKHRRTPWAQGRCLLPGDSYVDRKSQTPLS